jgi:hypothetical protein
MIDIAKIDESKQSGDQNTLVSGDGKVGVAAQCLAQVGTAYRPKKGALAVSLAVAGNSGNSAIIPLETSKKVVLAEGESAFGNFEAGCYMIFRNDGSIQSFGDWKHKGNVSVNGNLTVTGDLTVTGQTQSETISASSATIDGIGFSNHKHSNPEGGNTGGPT